MGTGAEFVAADALLADAAIEAAVYEAGAGFLGTGGAALTEAGIGAGIGDFAVGADLFSGGTNFAADLGLSPQEYEAALQEMGPVSEATSNVQYGDVLNPEVQGYQAENYVDPSGTDTQGYDYGQQPTQTLDSSPTSSLDSQYTSPGEADQALANQQVAQGRSPWQTLKDVVKSPQYQVAKTGIDLYSQFGDSQAAKAGLNRYNQLADTGAPFRNMAMNTYNDPGQYFNSPTYKGLASMYQNQYQRQQAASGRRTDKAGLALAMQNFGAKQFNDYTAGLSRFAGNPNLTGLQGMYQGAGKAQSNLLNTFANKDLWDAVG